MYDNAWKVSICGVILVRIQSECGKIWTRITPNLCTFCAVWSIIVLAYPTCYIRSRLPITYKKLFFKSTQNSQENTCAKVSFEQSCHPTVCNFIKKETLAQMFPCVIFEIFQISFFAEYPRESPITLNTNHGHNLG